MNVQDLREALAELPGHWPVHVAVPANGSGGGADTDFLYTLDVQRDNFPTQGNMAVIRLDTSEVTALELAWLRSQRKHPEREGDGVLVADNAQPHGAKNELATDQDSTEGRNASSLVKQGMERTEHGTSRPARLGAGFRVGAVQAPANALDAAAANAGDVAGHAVLAEVVKWALAGHIGEAGVTVEACKAIRDIASGAAS